MYRDKGIYYIEHDSSAYPYRVLEKTDVEESDIEYGHRYTYFKDEEGNLYTGFITNSLEPFQKAQLRLEL